MISSVTFTPVTPKVAAHALEKTGNGEYSAASVRANPGLAAGLVKLKDGNFAYPIVSAADRASSIEASLSSLRRGG